MAYARVNGIKLYYEAMGSGAPLVLLHGLGSSHEDWLMQIPAFSPHYHVIAADCRGHGDSEKPPGPYSIPMFASDILALLDQLALDPVHLLGISMGGLVAQQMVLDAPDWIRSLVLVNTFSHLQADGLGDWIALLRRIVALRFRNMEQVGHVVARQLFPKAEQALLREMTAQRWAKNDKRAYQAATMAIWRFDVTERLGEIDCPTLIVAGENDGTVAPRHREVLHRNIAGSQLAVIPDSTHATPIDQPQAFNQIVMDFLRTVPS
jgi:3-oxoadipate enol-lactonase